jgi:O-succinylbenzoate synthase
MQAFQNVPPIDFINIHPIAMPIVEKLVTSFGGDDLRPAVLVEIGLGGVTGWGECVAAWAPGYSYETIGTALHILQNFMVPALIGQADLKPLDKFRGHPMARMAVEAAYWAAVAALRDVPIAELFWPERKARVLVGVSIGIQTGIDATLAVVGKRIAEGYKRIKLKIKPGWDVEMLRAVRGAFPEILLMADANSAYTLDDAPLLKQLDALNLIMIEQPLGHDDIYQHSKLQPQLQTPICLDESIRNVDDARLAIQIGAGKIINLKPGRVGGITESLRIHQYCYENGIPLWHGGMLETGVGRAMSVALASLPGFTLPSDISATDRYYNPDLTDEVFTLNREDSTLTALQTPGLGVHVNAERLQTAKAEYQKAVTSIYTT